MKSLVLTLGHGSSAILIEDDKIVNGYQNERITKVKSDSVFPMHAIEEMMKWDDIPKDVTVYVSHWEPSANLNKMSKRHWNPDYLNKRFPNHKIRSLNIDFTHHKAHAYSALAYTKDRPENCHIMVADGFGNFGEVLTIYKIENNVPVPIFSSHGYDSSLGLLYQYATDYVGLKMNQDEWKLNAAATNVSIADIPMLLDISEKIRKVYLKRLISPSLTTGDPITNLGALSYTHKMVLDLLSKHFKSYEKEKIAFVLQEVVEGCILTLINEFKINNLLCVGGVFMNVQLNNRIAMNISGKVSVMPLSGDSGAGLGVYKYHNPGFTIPDSLCWGKRRILGPASNHLSYTKDITSDLIKLLDQDKIVNIVRGKMEFGERAYCNTSTIAIPSKESCNKINIANGRDGAMPMAPIVTENLYKDIFMYTDKVIRSSDHMIMSLPYSINTGYIKGVAHYLPSLEIHTGRPQIIYEDDPMSRVINNFGPLINTSFNIHGQPICMDNSDILKAHIYQQANSEPGTFYTLIEE